MPGRRPLVRPLELVWMDHQNEKLLVLRDRTGLLDEPVAVPPIVGFILSLCDGQRDEDELRAAIEREAGEPIPADALASILDQLERSLILEGPAVEAAQREALAAYRAAPSRPARCAGSVYPLETGELRRRLEAYGPAKPEPASAYDGDLRGVVSPHIDYQRGGPTYHRAWHRAAPALRRADVLVVFGTDHAGGPGRITLTRQSYDTPFGPLETDRAIVDALADALGEEDAFAEELHHRGEHSIELAAVWAASLLGERRPTVVPILCGSFGQFTHGQADPADDPRFARLLDALDAATAGKRVLAVSSADFAHVGPAFGDPHPLDAAAKERLRAEDERLLHAVAWGRADDFFAQLRAESDARKVCGLPPTYLLLRHLRDARGEALAYAQCPADPRSGSIVSIAGLLLW